MDKVIIQLSQGGTGALMEISSDELQLLNEKKRELVQQDPSWRRREIDILEMVQEELKTKQK